MPGEVKDLQKRKRINKMKDKDAPAAKSLSRMGTWEALMPLWVCYSYERRSKLLKPSCFFYKQKNISKKFLMPSFLFASVNEKQFSTAEDRQTQQRCYVWQKCWTTMLKSSFTAVPLWDCFNNLPRSMAQKQTQSFKTFWRCPFFKPMPTNGWMHWKATQRISWKVGKLEFDWCEILCRCTQLGKHWVHQGCPFCSLFPWCPLDLSYLGDLLCHTQCHTLVQHDI